MELLEADIPVVNSNKVGGCCIHDQSLSHLQGTEVTPGFQQAGGERAILAILITNVNVIPGAFL